MAFRKMSQHLKRITCQTLKIKDNICAFCYQRLSQQVDAIVSNQNLKILFKQDKIKLVSKVCSNKMWNFKLILSLYCCKNLCLVFIPNASLKMYIETGNSIKQALAIFHFMTEWLKETAPYELWRFHLFPAPV